MANPQQVRESARKVVAEFQAMAPALGKVLDGAVPVRLTPSEVHIIAAAVEAFPALGSVEPGKHGTGTGFLKPGGRDLLTKLLNRIKAAATPGARDGVMSDLGELRIARRLRSKLQEALTR